MELLITYDISTIDNAGIRRLARVAKVCESYGLRVQDSVFECRISQSARLMLVAELSSIIDPDLDSVYLYSFPGELRNVRQTLGCAPTVSVEGPWIV